MYSSYSNSKALEQDQTYIDYGNLVKQWIVATSSNHSKITWFMKQVVNVSC